jgi:hypothetical protein
VAGKPRIELFLDLKTEREQNKSLFWERISMSQDSYSSLQSEYWSRNYFKPFVDSGAYSDVREEVRQSYFGPKGEWCQVADNGVATYCDQKRVGYFSGQGKRTECRPSNGVGLNVFYGVYKYTNENCKETKVNYDSARAYFLVFPGTYMMKWSELDWGGDSVTKSGIVVN